jgi:hypothetical protein
MAAGATYEPIATTTLGSAAASVSFTSISGSYTDLVLIGNGYNATGTGLPCRMRFNSDTGSNYSLTNLTGNGSSASSGRGSNQAQAWVGYSVGWDNNSSEPTFFIANIMNYSNSTTYKTALVRNNQPTGDFPGTEVIVNLWRNTSAITSIEVYINSGTFATGSTFTLYGILSA